MSEHNEHKTLYGETKAAIDSADWLTGADAGQIQALTDLGSKIDDALLDLESYTTRDIKDLMLAYNKISESLGLSPNTRAAWERRQRQGKGTGMNKLQNDIAKALQF
jgi:hypothetical protein|nr:MAG TPA: hypothetical protein [Caudoviricetes sp.]DAS96769.1 MAG TPA: hypothetical protein [Caudoviricetes sp.]DAW76871.1 MAG TPA: hypothetical protein [Caudoviricetes sp.]